MKLLLVGAAGMVGSHVLQQGLQDPRVDGVVAPVRRPLPAQAGLLAPTIDFDHLPEDADWWKVDAVICTLGTTIRTAGSQAAFRRVDHDYPLAVARIAHRHGVRTFALNSAMGADASSRIFYSRVKGELERDLAGVGFDSLTYVRPGLIGGPRQERRTGESVAKLLLTAIGPVLPRSWRINPAERIAEALIDAALRPRSGIHIVSADQLN